MTPNKNEIFHKTNISHKKRVAYITRLKKTIGFGSRHVASDGTCTSDLCYQSARRILDHAGVDKDEIEGVLLVTQSPDYRAPSTAIILQDRLGLTQNVVAYDINLGCSGFVFGLFTAPQFHSERIE